MDLIEHYGFNKEVDYVESKLFKPDVKDERLERISNLMMKRYHLRFGEAKNTNDFIKKYADKFFDIIDETYKDIYGSVPFTEATRKLMISNFKLIVNVKNVAVILDENDEVVCFGICFPSLAKAVQKSKGHLTPLALIRLLNAIKHPKVLDLGLIGVKEEYLQKIFEPFERLKTGKLKNIEGTGLGLSIANSIVKLMGGDIKVESKVGKGSKFTITFMAYFQEKEEKLLANSADLSVLIVDSDVYSRAEEMNILQKMDVDCKCEVNGLEAIETLIKAKGCGKQYSAVIIDWDIEGMSAADTIKNIYDIAGNSLPVFVTTLGKSQYIKKDFCDKLECSFILKPLFASKILKAFNKVMPDLFEVQSVNDIAEQKYNGKNIILAGKDSSNLELFRILGINTDVVETEKELLELFESNKKYYYDAIIVDMQIEQMNGYAVACAIRSFEREDAGEIPIIAKVPNIFSVDVYAGLSSGISAYANENSEDIEMLNILDKWLCGTYAEKKLIAEKNEEIQEHIRKLEFQASHDSFTGVLNKTAIFKQADDIIKEKEDAVHGMLVLDIDGFKNINDLYGHSEGDKVIYELAQILQDMFRESDIVGRFGGDEFVVFMKDIKSVDMSEKKAEVLIKTVREHFAGRFGEIDLTISVGVVNSRIGYNSVRMFEKADKALYYAKENGKNCYYVYDSITE